MAAELSELGGLRVLRAARQPGGLRMWALGGNTKGFRVVSATDSS